MMMKRWNDPYRAGFDNCGVRYVRKIGVPLMLLIAVCVLILYAAMDLSAQPQEHILSIGLDVTALFGVIVLTAVCSIGRIPEDKSPLFFLAMLLCDYYEYQKGNPEAVKLYRGSYMEGYEWAAATRKKLKE